MVVVVHTMQAGVLKESTTVSLDASTHRQTCLFGTPCRRLHQKAVTVTVVASGNCVGSFTSRYVLVNRQMVTMAGAWYETATQHAIMPTATRKLDSYKHLKVRTLQ